MTGVPTPNLPAANFIDDLVGNYEGQTVRLPWSRVLSQIASAGLSFPQFMTRAEAQAASLQTTTSYIVVGGQIYQSDPAGAALTTAGGLNWSPVGARVTARAYGCAGDGVRDDWSRLTAAIAETRRRGVILDCEGLTYRIGSQLTEIAGHVENLTLDATAVTADIAWDMVGPGLEVAKPLTANAYQGGRQLNITAHGYAVGDIVLARSDMILETATNSVCAHWAEVVAVTTNTITLSHSLLCNLLTANNARVQRLKPSAGTRLRNIRVLGSSTCPGGVQMTWLSQPEVDTFEAVGCEVRGLSLVQSFQPRAGNIRGIRCDRPGLGYALNVSGCGWAEIGDVFGRRCRHVQTWGAAATIPCVGGFFGAVIGAQCLGSAFDTHPGAISIWHRDGLVIADMSSEYAGQDAITSQGAGGSVRARITGQVGRHLCLIQPFHNAAAFQTFPTIEIDVSGDAPNGQGVSLDLQGSAGLRLASVQVVGTHNTESVFVRVANGSGIGSLVVGGEASSGARAIFINCQSTGQIASARLAGRFKTRAPSVVAANIVGPTDTATPRASVMVAGLDTSGGSYGLRADNRVDVKGGVAAFLAGATAATFTSAGATIN